MFAVEREVLEFPFRYNGHTQHAPIELYHQQDALIEGADLTMAVLGLGNEGLYARRLTKIFGETGLPAVSVVFHFPNAESINPVCMGGVKFVASYLNKRTGFATDWPMSSISHSQGGGIVLASAKETPQHHGARQAIIAPVGLNSSAMGPQGDLRRREFWHRYLLRNTRQTGQMTDFRHWRAGVGAVGRLVSDTVGSRVNNGYSLLPEKVNYALSDRLSDLAVSGLRYLAAFANPLVIVGENDPIFAFDEIVRTIEGNLGEDPISIAQAPGAHEPLIGRLGMKQLRVASAHIENLIHNDTI